MMGMIWVVLLVALAGSHLGHCSPLRSTPQTYPHDAPQPLEGWGSESGVYAAVPALALILTAVTLLLGCTWCYRHKDCKPNEGADNQLFTASVTHLHDGRRSQPPDSGFSEPANNNISEDNNNGPISLREMQNIANNNAAAYIVSENEERNRVSRESVVEFEPLPTDIRVVDPLEHCADWFGENNFPRDHLQYLREIGRGWFGRVVEGEIEESGVTSSVAVTILNQNASLEDKARFLDEARMFRNVRHENVLAFVAKCLEEEPWILLFELCSMDLQQYLVMNRPKMAILNESGVPLRLMCDVTAALEHLHSRGYLYGNIWCGAVLIRGSDDENVRGVLGRYTTADPPYDFGAPETRTHPPVYTASSDLWSLGTLVWEVCAWGASPTRHPPPLPDLPCPYRNHLYQVMQLCWQVEPTARGSSRDILALLQHLRGQHSADFEARWQRLKPNSIPTRDEHRAIVHAPLNVHVHDALSLNTDTAVSRSSSIMSDTDPLSIQIKSESLTNLHGSLEDVRNIYLTHNETAVLDCHQGNISLEESREKEHDRSDASMDPWLKDIIAGSQDDVSYYKDVSDVIKNLDNILNSEKTSSSESSHQASPSRDNLSLDCKKEYPVQSSMVKSPGINNFQNILDTGLSTTDEDQICEDDEVDRDTIGTLSHSFERHSEIDTTSQHTLENLTPDTPVKDIDIDKLLEIKVTVDQLKDNVVNNIEDIQLPNEIVCSDSEIPKLKELCVASIPSASAELNVRKDCQISCDSNVECTDLKEGTKSIDDIVTVNITSLELKNKDLNDLSRELVKDVVLPKSVEEATAIMQVFHENLSELKEEMKSIEEESLTNDVSITEVLVSDLIKEKPEAEPQIDILNEHRILDPIQNKPEQVQKQDCGSTNNINIAETETSIVLKEQKSIHLPPEQVQIKFNDNSDIEKAIISAKAIADISFTKESDFNTIDKDNDSIINDQSFSEEHSISDDIANYSENKTVTEYTKWINFATNPQRFQHISNFIQSEREHSLHDENGPNLNSCTAQGKNDKVIENECSSCVETSQIIEDIPETSLDFSLDSLMRESLQDIHEAGTEEVTETSNPIIEPGTHLEEEAFPKYEAVTIPTDIFIEQNAVPTNTEYEINHIETFRPNSEDSIDMLTENQLMFKTNCKDVIDYRPCISENKDFVIETGLRNSEVNKEIVINSVQPSSHNCDLVLNTKDFRDKNNETEEVPIKDMVVFEQLTDSLEAEINQATTEHQYCTKSDQIINDINLDVSIDSNTVNDTGTSVEANCIVVKDTLESSEKINQQRSNNSTVYMDLINNTNSEILTDNTLDNNVRDIIKSCLETSNTYNECSLAKNESTEYLDLPSFKNKDVHNFLHMERVFSSCNSGITSSTPLASDSSTNANSIVENSSKETTEPLSETIFPNYGPGVSLTKLEQKCVPDNFSPFESPTKSHPTDTYDENSSVVLGPFENCSLELFKAVKSCEIVDLPKEELLAFSSNFSEMNLETPSPLRDGNFLNEVPDLSRDDIQFDDIRSISDKPSEPTETDSGNSTTEKRISPSTPPNSPGIFLASTSQQKYLVDINLVPEPVLPEQDLTLEKEIELNQIELQITSKLAMAENENNMNIEYSGPLTVEGLISSEGMMLRDSDALPESYLAGNGGSIEDIREGLTLDEECVKALRNELELKLPLAQVAAIEPQCENENEWSTELPPPPELVVNYPGALSPIAEETGQQLSAYENDTQWNLSIRTDSSESYPEPCNNSTDEVTELPTGAQSAGQEPSTYTVHSKEHSQNNTYTLHKEQIDIASSREMTMSADSLNASPYKHPMPDIESPIDDKTYTKEEEKESLERISQVSPFLLSPTTDTSAPDNSDNFDNATGVSTLSKTTLPTDAKISKPSETQCLSKATSIDSWCSNDTLYNVEENFDDLAMDPDVPEFQPEKEEGNSESTDTLTHNEDEKEASHCSTYIIHDSKSEACETFSPDSITANDNYTYTKVKTDPGTTPSVLTTMNDSTKNSETKDLAYGTLISGLPSYSNCTTELASLCDNWKVQQPEMVRKSPMPNNMAMTPSNISDEKVNASEDKVVDVTSPRIETEPSVKKMDSVDISCLQDNLTDSHNKTEVSETEGFVVHIDSPNYGYKNMAPSVTSTPLIDLIDDTDVEAIPMTLPQTKTENTSDSVNIPNFQMFLQSAEVRPQDLSSNASNEVKQDTELLLEGDSNALSRNSNRETLAATERTPTYSDFENSAISKPQDVNVKEKSSQSYESGISSGDFQKFKSSVSSRPQDLSSLIDASSLLLKSERMSSELAMCSIPSDCRMDQTSQDTYEESHITPPINMNLKESHSLVNFREPSFLLNFDADDEMDQPHSIIITETTMEAFKENPIKAFDSHKDTLKRNQNELHSNVFQPKEDFEVLFDESINIEKNKNEICPEIENQAHCSVMTSYKEPQYTSLPITAQKSNENKCNEDSEKFATVNFLSETFEELIESNVDDGETKELETENIVESVKSESPIEIVASPKDCKSIMGEMQEVHDVNGETDSDGKLTTVTQDFLHNEKKFCQLDMYIPMLSDIRFSGPASEIMSTSFTQDSPTEPTSGDCGRVAASDIIKEWDSDTDSHTSNSSSGEFIWKQRTGESQDSGCTQREGSEGGAASGASDASGDSGSGSEGDEVEFVPSSWDCRAAPAKSSLRSLEQATPDNKKRVVFKRQKYHCVYEYPREAPDTEAHSPAAYLPDLSTYADWDPSSAEDAELGYGQLFGAPSPLDLYPLRAGIAFGADYDQDFFISSSARPFESLGIMTSQFFPGKHIKPSLLERDLSDEVTEEFPPPPSPLPTTTLMQTRTPSLDFTTPDSGVEDITPGSTTDEDFKKKLPETELTWRPIDSGSSSESVSPSSPGGEALGGLRHTRDKLKLDLPPSPHIPSPRHNRVFNFILDKPKRRDERTDIGTTPLVMTDDTPIVTTSLPMQKECEDLPVPEPTFSTFGKSAPKVEPEQKLILTDEVEEDTVEVKEESPSPKVVEPVKGEGTVLDSGDEDSGIESSSKATLERNTNVS